MVTLDDIKWALPRYRRLLRQLGYEQPAVVEVDEQGNCAFIFSGLPGAIRAILMICGTCVDQVPIVIQITGWPTHNRYDLSIPAQRAAIYQLLLPTSRPSNDACTTATGTGGDPPPAH
jgi:hypothetical protein